MPTNTTTPEAATTTTPATNTNTTPLSAMTGEEVASILVGLIRQNDGVLIQTELENALRSTGYAAIANDMAQGKQALYTLLESKGVTIQGNESISECCTLLNAACLTIGNCKLASGQTWSMDSLVSNNYGNIFEVINTTATSVMSVGSNVKSIVAPNATSIASLENAIGLRNIYTPVFTNFIWNVLNSKELRIRHICINNQYNDVAAGRTRACSVEMYDMRVGEVKTVSWSMLEWRPSTALSSASQSLCTPDEWDDENQPTFDNNLQKFLWYFEYHFIPCFGTVTTSPVLSLYTTVYNAINSANSIAQPTKTLKQLLTDKGWEVASVS